MSTAQKTRPITATQAAREAFIEDTEFLVQHKVGLKEAARRLGYGEGHRASDNLRTRLRRYGRQDLIEQLHHNDDPYGPEPTADSYYNHRRGH